MSNFSKKIVKLTKTYIPKFPVGTEVRTSCGNSRTPIYEVLKYTPPDGKGSHAKYVILNTEVENDVRFEYEWSIKLATEVCEYEVYGDKMVGKTVKTVDYNEEGLLINFTDETNATFEVSNGDASLEFPESKNH